MSDQPPKEAPRRGDLREIVHEAIQEFVKSEQRKAEPVYKAELQDERKRRESLELKLNQLVEENRKARAEAEESDRHSQIRAELQRIGISKVDLAFRAIKDDIVRTEGGQLSSKGPEGKGLQDYVASFAQENPELLPARISGGSGAQRHTNNVAHETGGIVLDAIRPDMGKDELERARQQIAKLAWQALRGA